MATTTTTGPQVTYEATLGQDEETGGLELSLYRSVHAGVCGPWGTVPVPAGTEEGVALPMGEVVGALMAAGWTPVSGFKARRSCQGMVLVAEVKPIN